MSDLDRVKKLAGILTEEMDKDESVQVKEENKATMPFMDVIYQYVDEDESSGDARLYLDGERLVDDVRYMLEQDNPDVEIIALSESKGSDK